jgi:hypothetical protein
VIVIRALAAPTARSVVALWIVRPMAGITVAATDGEAATAAAAMNNEEGQQEQQEQGKVEETNEK